jgi:Ca2+-binding RTX toxin-like protein
MSGASRLINVGLYDIQDDGGLTDTSTQQLVNQGTFDWGDGTTSAATVVAGAGGGVAVGTHTYALGGLYPVTATLSDDGATTTGTTQAVITGAGVHHGVLQIIGTSGDDTVFIDQIHFGQVPVFANFVPHPGRAFPAAGITQILMELGDGNDRATIDSRITIPALLDGGAGNDTLQGGGGDAILIGGAGNDVLYGGLGHNLMIGGTGANRIAGGNAGDILIAGSTDYDTDLDALARIMAEWTSPASYADRVRHLLFGGGLNGTTVLNASTVHADGTADSMHGGSGPDLFFARLGQDIVAGLDPSETVVAL